MVVVPKYVFVTSLIITLLVFGAGILLGWKLDTLRSGDINEDLRMNELDAESYLIEQTFWESFGGDDCSFAEQRLNSLSAELVILGQYLNNYQQKNMFEEKEFEYIARRYFLLEIKGYLLFNELKQECDIKDQVILYFYTPAESQSEMQGYVLDRIVENSNGTINVFSINKDFEDDGAIDSLILYYNITQSPTIIINGEIKKEGYVSYSEIVELLGADF